MRSFGRVALAAAALALGAAQAAHAADAVKIGTLRLATYGPLYIAVERGYFAAEGIAPELVFFEAAQPIAVGIASGALQFGVSGSSGGFYNLAAKGELEIVGGGTHEYPGFHFFALVAGRHGWEAGLTQWSALGGHSIAVSQIGSPSHYSVALIEEKFAIPAPSVRVLPLQSTSNQMSAIAGGQADATVINITSATDAIARGDAKLIGYIGDVVPWQVGIVYAATRTANEESGLVNRFLAAYRKGAADYHDAFTAPDGTRHDNASAAAILAICAKYTGQPVARLSAQMAYVDRLARLDEPDISHQIGWYRQENMVKGPIDAAKVIDKRYVVALPGR